MNIRVMFEPKPGVKCNVDKMFQYYGENYLSDFPEFKFGGYEIEEAHRFYGLGAAFAPGSAELLEKSGRLVFYSARIKTTKSN